MPEIGLFEAFLACFEASNVPLMVKKEILPYTAKI
jgi:hypothetical protein